MKEKYLTVATELFARKGFTGVSIRELASAARANSALISYYFGGKEGLYSTVLNIQFEPIMDLLRSVRDLEADPEEKLRLYARGAMSIHQRFPFVIRFLHGELTNPTPFLESIILNRIAQVQQFLYKAICSGIDDGRFRKDLDPAFTVIALVGMLNFYFLARPIARNFMPDRPGCDQDFSHQAIEIFLRGIRRDVCE